MRVCEAQRERERERDCSIQEAKDLAAKVKGRKISLSYLGLV